MPLPTAPSKRADRLTAKDFEAPARAKPRAARKAPTEVIAEPVSAVAVKRSTERESKRSTQSAALTHSPVMAPTAANVPTPSAKPLPVAAPVAAAAAVTAAVPDTKRSKRAKTSGPKK